MVALEGISEFASKYPDEAVADFTVSINTPSVSVAVNKDNYEKQEKREVGIDLDCDWFRDCISLVLRWGFSCLN